jgi:hypothetical protein
MTPAIAMTLRRGLNYNRVPLYVKLPYPSAHTTYSKVQFQHYFITLRSLPKDTKTLASVRHLTGLPIRSRRHRGQHETQHCDRKTRQAYSRPSPYTLGPT